ncbi:inactive ubiquitin carboxyl-terminal hydrolase 50 isoform X3 [Cyanistes caeruleus]|uniref:inactive ubiquitin carboxyl-terminal hydrolase 50 isoform X3 n=1 Tax=Cyanistes caeruleus TaxID=156563 RepID=UPI000CDB5FDB|nr:inactive ubiquitin carboxyl-terminal hydrolase 50 isoform X3 [Cyanistes caeruleus]
MEIAVVLEFSVLPQIRTSASKKEQHQWKDGMEMEVFPQGTAGRYKQPAPRAHRAAEPGEHVLHERGAAVPLQPDPARAAFPLRNVEHSPARPSQERQSPAAEASTRSSSGTSIITELFEGQLSYGIRCLRCKALSHRPESFTILSLPIPSTRVCSLQDCLECFFQPDTLTQNNQIHCYWCGGNQDATVKASITKAPQIIIFHLKRFAWQDKHRRKLSTTVCYPFSDLDLSPYISASCCNNTEYSLCAVVNHAGDLDYGHYTAFCKHAVTKHWYSFDDAQVTEIPDSEVQADTAYLLFYTSKGY